ncbi:MAG TPA: acetyl-CoA C-acyltransferase [Bryobacteraceae bacterium]|nr:acetyl-CoA C-acyltransferase [Bryobacterales bacterium]HRJ18197.1 acetyl-CoA C-acyltransferase [Bryobacteraceae bacterium]
MKEAVIIDCVRTPVGKAPKGSLRHARPDDLAAAAIRGLLERYPGVPRALIDDVILGCAMPEGEQGMNVARIAALAAGLPVETPAVTINRFCSSGLQAIAMAVDRIRAGGAEAVIAGGTESMSLVPMAGHKFAPNPRLVEEWPEVYISMGLTAERVQQRLGITREEQDAFALRSHERALMAQAAGHFDEEIVALPELSKDEGPRGDTSMEALGKLRAAFHAKGTVTAGNASQMSDGAAAALVVSEGRAREWGLKPAARLASYAVAGIAPEIMGLGPVKAIPKALAMAGLRLEEIGVIELNEAFAVQALGVIREAGLDPAKVNVNGGAIALGHPLGCTGAKLTATILREMRRGGHRYGMVTMCIGGGQGAAGILEAL